ncbi:MAG: ATP phosphoribosyltransferase regulatory subunit [Cardiobacteriaceae bacterium]|nr:ATP phosphoribosyltransferase regulatory subunit [Cardiobacteriaceae bacterium]
MNKRHWLLPEDIIELLPNQAAHIEKLRRLFLDNTASWGYQLLMPPLAEFLDSLLAGSENLDLQTFKITDRISGRMLGVRADFTPQIARIDAHRLPTDAVSRYCYCGEVLRTKSESTVPRRNPLITGAELFGAESLDADIEVTALLIDTMQKLGLKNSVLNLGHSGIFAGLVDLHRLNNEQCRELRDVLVGLRRPDLHAWTQKRAFPSACIEDIRFLVDAPIAADILGALQNQFAGRHKLFDRAIGDLIGIQKQLAVYFPEQKTALDISAIGTYGYHSGAIFSLYADGHYDAIARGGRYDGLGAVYGRARAATGFSLDLLTLGEIVSNSNQQKSPEKIDFPHSAEEFRQIQNRRQNGEKISFEYPQGN